MSDSDSDEAEQLCPLCCNELDITDRHFRPCACGYQICAWCWHQLMEIAAGENSTGRCPACRAEYDEANINFTTPAPEELEKAGKKKSKEKKEGAAAKAPAGSTSPAATPPQGGPPPGMMPGQGGGPPPAPAGSPAAGPAGANGQLQSRKHLYNVRVIQRNLVYVVGLSMNCCREDVLRRQEYFGKYGKIVKISVNRNGSYSSGRDGHPSGSAYVTYQRPEDALRCIQAIDGVALDGRILRACFGTTKYCNAFLKHQPCNNPDCLYLHDIGDGNDSFTKEEMLAKYGSKHQSFHEATHPSQVGPGMPGMPPHQMAAPPLPPGMHARQMAAPPPGMPGAGAPRSPQQGPMPGAPSPPGISPQGGPRPGPPPGAMMGPGPGAYGVPGQGQQWVGGPAVSKGLPSPGSGPAAAQYAQGPPPLSLAGEQMGPLPGAGFGPGPGGYGQWSSQGPGGQPPGMQGAFAGPPGGFMRPVGPGGQQVPPGGPGQMRPQMVPPGAKAQMPPFGHPMGPGLGAGGMPPPAPPMPQQQQQQQRGPPPGQQQQHAPADQQQEEEGDGAGGAEVGAEAAAVAEQVLPPSEPAVPLQTVTFPDALFLPDADPWELFRSLATTDPAGGAPGPAPAPAARSRFGFAQGESGEGDVSAPLPDPADLGRFFHSLLPGAGATFGAPPPQGPPGFGGGSAAAAAAFGSGGLGGGLPFMAQQAAPDLSGEDGGQNGAGEADAPWDGEGAGEELAAAGGSSSPPAGDGRRHGKRDKKGRNKGGRPGSEGAPTATPAQ
mmetsp:Transcript_15602/g.53287  ORF Transcript_15602/g.53287 Transcript_15602/m.53287 type:complete len:774 (-) Transcript_15602:39-2360(-)